MGPPEFSAEATIYQSPHHYPGKAASYTGVSRRISYIFHESGHQVASILR